MRGLGVAVFAGLALLAHQSLAVSRNVYGAQRRSTSDLARLLKRNSYAQQAAADEIRLNAESDSYLPETAELPQNDEDYLRLLSDIASLLGNSQQDGAEVDSGDAPSLTEVEDEIVLPRGYEDEIVAAAETAETLLQNIDAAVAGLPNEDANRVALAYLLDAFDLDMRQADFDLLTDQVNNLENAYAQLSETLASLQVQ
eukprot:Selendium_serpulae@DN5643_c0_g1_i1.p1